MKNTWYEAECISAVQPPAREEEISDYVVYLRKNFHHEPAHKDEQGQMVPEKWTYLETTIPKDVAELLHMTDDNSSDIADCENAICELSMGGVV